MSTATPVTLEGRLVRLEPLAPSHLEGLLAAASADPAETFPHTWVPRARGEVSRFIDDALALAAARRAIPFATVAVADGRGGHPTWRAVEPSWRRPASAEAGMSG